MEITEVKIQLKDAVNKKLKAYATVTFDNQFVVRFVKVIQGNQGLFIAMPARKVKIFCPRCGKKTEVRSKFCNWCGIQLPPPPRDYDRTSPQQQHQDIAHPINQQFREYLQTKVLDAYHHELNKVPPPETESRVQEEKPQESMDIGEPARQEPPSSGQAPEIDLSKLDF